MSNSSEYLYRCLDTIKLDKNLSEITITLMFQEYARLVAIDNTESIKSEKLNLDSCEDFDMEGK